MTQRFVFVIAIIGVILTVVLMVPWTLRKVEYWAAGIHQRNITRELAAWETEYAQVRNVKEVDHAIDMLEYVQWYYVPGPGFHSDERTEAALEAQRTRTISAIVSALREFTGQDFGADAERWRAWRKQQDGVPQN
jgi:hypothetical protein